MYDDFQEQSAPLIRLIVYRTGRTSCMEMLQVIALE